jgi:hypothetical protein
MTWLIVSNFFGFQNFSFVDDINSLISDSTLPFVNAQSDKAQGKQVFVCADGSKPNPAGQCRDGSEPRPVTVILLCTDGSRPNNAGKCRDGSEPRPVTVILLCTDGSRPNNAGKCRDGSEPRPVTGDGTPTGDTPTGTGGTGTGDGTRTGDTPTGTGGTGTGDGTPPGTGDIAPKLTINKELLRNVAPSLGGGGIEAEPDKAPPIMEAKVTIKLTSVDVIVDHDYVDGEYWLYTDIKTKGYAQPGCARDHQVVGSVIFCDLLDLSVARGLYDVSDHERVNFIDQAEWVYKFDKNTLTRTSNEYMMVVNMHMSGWELDGCTPKGVPDSTSISGLLVSCTFGNDPDRLKEISKTHYIKFPNKYGLEELIFSDRNSDYQLNYKIIVEAQAPVK